MHSYHHHSRKVLKICVHPQKPFEILSCSADGTIRHFDIRKKYKKQKFTRYSQQDIITQGFGGGPRTNRGRFSESLLYDFNTFNKHWQVYSVDMNPVKPTEIVSCCGDGPPPENGSNQQQWNQQQNAYQQEQYRRQQQWMAYQQQQQLAYQQQLTQVFPPPAPEENG
eukprot:125683_1